MHPYSSRPIRPLGLERWGEWRLKLYSIRFEGGEEVDPGRFGDAMARAREALPHPALAGGRPGVGFLILHQGRGVDYAVLGWWDRENELPLRVWVRDGEWRPARGSESVCVWDLQVIGFERDAYVATLLAGGSAGEYLARTLTEA